MPPPNASSSRSPSPSVSSPRRSSCTASIGMALDDSGTESAEDLLAQRRSGHVRRQDDEQGRYEVFSTDMHSMILDRMQVEVDLRRALDAE